MGVNGRRPCLVRVRRLAPGLFGGLLSALVFGSAVAGAATGSGPAGTGSAPGAWSARVGVGEVQRAVYGRAAQLVRLRLQNTGARAWPATGPDAVHVAYHWLRSDGSAAVWDGQRTSLSDPVPPGGSTSVSATITAPEKPGRYRLQFDLVSRASRWFSEQGWAAPTIPVTVGRPASRYFAASIAPVQLPGSLAPRTVSSVVVRVTNTGALEWPMSGPRTTFLSYHWLRLDGSSAVWEGRRTSLTHPVRANASIEQPLVVETPDAVGRYQLQFDAISLQVGWFSRLGSVSPPTSVIDVEATSSGTRSSHSHWALAFGVLLATIVGALVWRRRTLRRNEAIDAVGADAEAAGVEEAVEPDVAYEAEAEPLALTSPPKSGVVTATEDPGSNGRATDAEADEAREPPPAAAATGTIEPTGADVRGLADFMRARGALRDR